MKTVNTVLPIYDRIIKQCYERSKHVCGDKEMKVPVITPRHRLPAMQWNVGTDDPGELIGINLVNEEGIEKDILNYFNRTNKYHYDWAASTYDVLTDPGPPNPAEITDCQKTTAAGEARAVIVLKCGAFTEYVYDQLYYKVRIDVTLNLISGTAPKMELRDIATGLVTYSNTITLINGRNVFFLEPTGSTNTACYITIFNGNTETCRFSLTHNNIYGIYAFHPRLYTNTDGDEYFMYNEISTTLSPTLKYLLDPGLYYLKFISLNGYIYYSDWFLVDCVYDNLISTWTNLTYDASFDSIDTEIILAETGTAGAARSDGFDVRIDEVIRVICFLTSASGAVPTMKLYADGAVRSNVATLARGLNDILLTSTYSGEVYLKIENVAATNFKTEEILCMRDYSDKYLTFEFSHSCNLGDLIYEDDFVQILWLEAETMEPVFPYTEKGQENGYGQFISTFQRQEKNWIIRTLLIPQFIVDVLHRLKLHDQVYITDLVGDTMQVKSIDVEHEWQFSDKYYATATITVNLGEEIVTTACCTEINECP